MPSRGSKEMALRALARERRELRRRWIVANRPDLVVRREKDLARKRRRDLATVRVHYTRDGSPPPPVTEADLAKSFQEEIKQRKKYRDASIAGCDELLRLLRLHHPERERVAA